MTTTETAEKFVYIDIFDNLMGPYDSLDEAEAAAAEELSESSDVITIFRLQPRRRVILKPTAEEIEADESDAEIENAEYEADDAA